MKTSDSLALGGFAAVSAAASLLGARVANDPLQKLWYRILRKPPQTPPDKLFGLVWPVLYGLSAYSGYRAWKHRKKPGANATLALWGAQLAFNAAWTPLFFGKRRARAALVDLGLNFGSLAAYTARVAKVDPTAAWLMAPYLGWLLFAGSINFGVIRRNPAFLAG
jgi:benzodiazapine receptor